MKKYTVTGQYGWRTTVKAENLADAKAQVKKMLTFNSGNVYIERDGEFKGGFRFWQGVPVKGARAFGWEWVRP